MICWTNDSRLRVDTCGSGQCTVQDPRGGGRHELAAFGHNINDEENLKGAIDFNNNAGSVNERRFLGLSFKATLN